MEGPEKFGGGAQPSESANYLVGGAKAPLHRGRGQRAEPGVFRALPVGPSETRAGWEGRRRWKNTTNNGDSGCLAPRVQERFPLPIIPLWAVFKMPI